MAGLIGRQAVVVGAGMGGLTAARALADRFEYVLVFDRDALPQRAEDRPGVPQGKHVHLLLAGGLRALNELFPGFENDLARAGAVPIRIGLDIRLETPEFTPFPQRDLGIRAYAMSRPLVELTVRRRVQSCRTIEVRQGCRVQELIARDGGAAIAGVRYSSDHASETLEADFVVDASGRGTLSLRLLEAIGRQPPPETSIGVDLTYATAVFEIPAGAPGDWKGVFTIPGGDGRGGLMLPLERNRWILTVAGRHSVKPPGDEAGFMDFVAGLRTPTIFDAIKHAKRLGEIARFAFSVSTRRHYAALPEFPNGLVPLGDAVCRFNPIYGQGMSVAAQEAVALGALLARRVARPEPLRGLGAEFFGEAVPIIDTPWASAVIPDFAHPETRGERPANLQQMLMFGLALDRLAALDPEVHKLTAEVRHLLKPRSVYQDPALVERVMAVLAERKEQRP
jgi:2-polyprenyl-6-methoxyphenol hydroxylase-like FAD-dependent oxidoreductase